MYPERGLWTWSKKYPVPKMCRPHLGQRVSSTAIRISFNSKVLRISIKSALKNTSARNLKREKKR
jgi:hypothetical protein